MTGPAAALVDLVLAGAEYIASKIRLKQARAEAERLALLDKLNAATEPQKD